MSDALLQEIRENRTFATNEWEDIRAEAKKDRLCVAGKPWEALDPQAVKERKETKRPFLALDELGQYINQTVNGERANPRGIRCAPTGNGANDAGAEFYQNHIREIEYRSHARVGYATALENAVTSGEGWIRIRTKRQHIRTFDQDLYIDPVVNADQVLPDPNAVWPDSRDIKFLYYIEPWLRPEFKRKFPKAKVRDFSSEWQKIAPQWIHGETVNVAEYWKFETFMRRLVAFCRKGTQAVTIALVDELPGGKLPAGIENLRDEQVEDSRVRSYLTNGIEILKEQPWAGKYIPFVSCYGKVLYVDDGGGSRRQILSMTRLARDPYMLYCYIRTCEAEAIGGVPRATWVGYEGQFAKPERWARANREPVAFLEGKVSVPGNPVTSPLPLPHKEPWDPPLQNLEIAAEAARRAIQAAMGLSPQPTEVQRRNDISGEAWKQRQSQSQRGSFHYVDHYDLMIERCGVVLEDLMDKVLDTARDVAVRKPDDSSAIVRINDSQAADPLFTKGDYRVTISTGPATDSQREAASDFVDTLVGNLQMIAELAGPPKAAMILAKSVKLKQLGPIGDEIVELLEPPQLKGKNGKPLPPEAQALAAQVQHLTQLLQKAAQDKEGRVVETQGKFAIEKYKTDAQSSDKAADRETKLAIAELGARVDRLALFLEERARLGVHLDGHVERHHEAHQAARDRAHDSIEQAKDRAHEHIQGALAHDRATELADKAVEGQLTVQAAAPTPTGGE